MIIRALPSTGKSWCLSHRSDMVDTDGLLMALTSDISGDAHERIRTDPALEEQFTALLDATLSTHHVVTNMDLSDFGHKADVIVGYEPDAYIEHIKQAGRNDLLDSFGEEELRGWAERLPASAILLKPNEYLSDALAKLRI